MLNRTDFLLTFKKCSQSLHFSNPSVGNSIVLVHSFCCFKAHSHKQTNKQTGNATSWSLLLPNYHVIACQSLLKQQCVSYQLVNGVPTVSHTYTLSLCLPGCWAGSHCLKLLADSLCLRLCVFVFVCV